jgi:hypothetical protein
MVASNANATQITRIVAPVASPYADTCCASTECAPSTRGGPKAYDRAVMLAELKALVAGRIDSYVDPYSR